MSSAHARDTLESAPIMPCRVRFLLRCRCEQRDVVTVDVLSAALRFASGVCPAMAYCSLKQDFFLTTIVVSALTLL
jgi:hypothetical protein